LGELAGGQLRPERSVARSVVYLDLELQFGSVLAKGHVEGRHRHQDIADHGLAARMAGDEDLDVHRIPVKHQGADLLRIRRKFRRLDVLVPVLRLENPARGGDSGIGSPSTKPEHEIGMGSAGIRYPSGLGSAAASTLP
jgi:hypothetical protein